MISADESSRRGEHAHRRTTQILFALNGVVAVHLNDGLRQKSVVLDKLNVGLLVPAQIWAAQDYKSKWNQLLVVCDELFDESDYIRDYDVFYAEFVRSDRPHK